MFINQIIIVVFAIKRFLKLTPMLPGVGVQGCTFLQSLSPLPREYSPVIGFEFSFADGIKLAAEESLT